ncbi:hypothetical protein [Kitasatospora sp. NPDC048538]
MAGSETPDPATRPKWAAPAVPSSGLHRGTLTALIDHGFRWFRFDG